MKEADRQEKHAATGRRRINIDFMYIDLEVCERCLGTDANLEAALSDVSHILEAAGAEVSLHKTLVESEAQARALGFITSPTIRVNGRDIALEFRVSRCDSCESCSCNGAVDCRVWVFQGREYTAAPKALIVDAILREVYGGAGSAPSAAPPGDEVPENLRRFFAGTAKKAEADASACCSPAEQATCCGPSEKAECCGAPNSTSCDCQ